MSRQQVDTDEGDITLNNNTGHIVVDNSENNNVDGGASQYNNEENDEETEPAEGRKENREYRNMLE